MLSTLIQKKDRQDLAHAAFLTLDRLVEREPADVLARLAADRALQESRPEMVSQEFARADLRDPAQRDIVKKWLLDPLRTGTQLRSFAAIYPNNNGFISNNLLTVQETRSATDLGDHDREALALVRDWQADPAFEPISSYLEVIAARLSQFVKSSPEASQR